MRNLRTLRGQVHRSLSLSIGSTQNSRTERRTAPCPLASVWGELLARGTVWRQLGGLHSGLLLVFFSFLSPSCTLRRDCSKPGLTRGGENVQWTSQTPSAWFVPYVATFLCLLPSFCWPFCWQILENWTRKTVETMVLWLHSPLKLCQQFSVIKNEAA